MTGFLAIFLVFLSNVLVTVLSFILALFSSRARKFFSKRKYDAAILAQIKQQRGTKKHCVVFYCSSAGEYEQARPLASNLASSGVYVHILFFSESGYNFASLRKEGLPFSLAPLDTLRNWREILAILNPNVVIIVRHELWPCFLFEASRKSKVYLINASLKSNKFLSLLIKNVLFSFVDGILTVSDLEKQKFCQSFSFPETSIRVTGDSKYDRVLERVEVFKAKPRSFPQLSHSKRKLILGSAWPDDCEIVLSAYARYKIEHAETLQLVIAPHQPNEEFLKSLISNCENWEMSHKLFSASEDTRDVDLVVIDSIGILFELYGVCDLAFVGGASHHEVHNVLEPSAFGLPLAFGPRYENSHEASEIISRNLAQVVRNSEDCLRWMKSALAKGSFDKELEDFVKAKGGATDKILSEIRSFLS